MAKNGGSFQFRVSDAPMVPLRGMMLRLRLVEGAPSVRDLGVGRQLRLTAPDGTTRDVTIRAHSVTGGRQTQQRLEQVREFDVIIDEAEALANGVPVEIGWVASGPIAERK